MFNPTDLFKMRLKAHVTLLNRYWAYIFNGHFMIALVLHHRDKRRPLRTMVGRGCRRHFQRRTLLLFGIRHPLQPVPIVSERTGQGVFDRQRKRDASLFQARIPLQLRGTTLHRHLRSSCLGTVVLRVLSGTKYTFERDCGLHRLNIEGGQHDAQLAYAASG